MGSSTPGIQVISLKYLNQAFYCRLAERGQGSSSPIAYHILRITQLFQEHGEICRGRVGFDYPNTGAENAATHKEAEEDIPASV
jgi:hypothetical protein